ncbi:cytochrome P450 [Aspergillus heteromorphus CBS 117.55]|uniref:Cytochrome P450 n=1 Tax=Aspergillus heteromorphus CBS 117.55 TaxID=1448321 RepID=A0A317W625_9EURO|nr:cytochrome P450 [Aspergillus heteromorphus CBS 117.55]PWY82056.1 cytochrome P450 [Aspergillus heteromorphus CBS 117.55]
MAVILDTAYQALSWSPYLLLAACILRCVILLRKQPFPANAPKFVSGYPMVGALQFFFDREKFFRDNIETSPTKSASFYLGRSRVVGLSGPQGRKTFFESLDLDLDQGAELFIPFVSSLERSDDPSAEMHDSHMRTSLRGLLLRTHSLEFVPAAMHACTAATWDLIAAKGLIDPFQEVAWLYTQSTMAALGLDEVARSPALSRKLSGLVSAMDGFFSAADMVVPWLLNPFHIPVAIAAGRLYVMLWQIVRRRKRQQQQQQVGRGDHKKEGLLQQLIDKGSSMRAISKATSPGVACWLLMGLATNAGWMARVRQEVDQVVTKHRKHGQSAEQVLQALDLYTWEHEFPIIEACLLESVRLSAGLVTFRKNISSRDVPIGDTGKVIPPGAYVTYSGEEVQMDPTIYPDPQRWDPGRFLPEGNGHWKEPMMFVGFGAGRKTCCEFAASLH